MQTHVKVLAVLFIVFSALLLLAALGMMAVFGGAAGIVGTAADGEDAAIALPIIGLTASVMDGDRQRCLEAGMNDHLAKPIDWDCLITLLNRMESEIHGSRALAS